MVESTQDNKKFFDVVTFRPMPISLSVLILTLFCPTLHPSLQIVNPELTQFLKGYVIEDFESGMVTLSSFNDEDLDSLAWEIDSTTTYDSTHYSLRLFGNTWKLEEITPCSLEAGDVWQVAVFVEECGEVQGFGISDFQNFLLYAFSGTEQLDPEGWVWVYQGAFPEQQWNRYLLPVAQNWHDWFGYYPLINGLIYINDRDYSDEGIIIFDEIYEITEDLPVPPEVDIQYTMGKLVRDTKGRLSVLVHFYCVYFDPDSDTLSFYWDFGDGCTSTLQNPTHEFLVNDDHSYTVRLEAIDTDQMWGRDTCRIEVDPGPTSFPLTINFVGDVMLARRYESPGGIIPTYGVEYIFESTLEIYGGAAEISVCNLECPLTDEGEPHPTKQVVFRSSPDNIAGLTYAGIDVVSIGNNHIIDYGARGMEETQEVLDTTGILFSGAGMNSYFARQPIFLSKDGLNIAFLSLCNRTGQYNNFQPFLNAGYNKPGFANLDEHNLARDIDYAKGLGDLVVVQLHSGIEYSTYPGDRLDGLEPWDPEVIRFPTKPSMTDRELRWEAVDLGADIVICHHPHVLQGFEVYNGKLIAHSLGNYIFDLNYPETYPTVILKSYIGSEGFHTHTLIPVFIDDYIPRPATGELGRHILDRLADYSRELGTIITVPHDSAVAHVILDTSSVETNVTTTGNNFTFEETDSLWVSEPIVLRGNGSLSAVNSINGGSGWEIRLGREVLWFGNFEDEGSTMWNLNSIDEWYDDSLCHSGQRSLCLRRYESSGDNIITDLEGRLPCDPNRSYTLCGWISTKSTNDATIQIRFYRYRYSGTHLSQQDVGTLVDGDTDWTFYQKELSVPSLSSYYNVRCSNDIPDSGVSYAWFDDIGVIEWKDWEPTLLPYSIPYPNDYRFLQISSTTFVDSGFVEYEETAFDRIETGVDAEEDIRYQLPLVFQNHPNPFTSKTTIRYYLPTVKGRLTPISLEIYNVLGQKVAMLVSDSQKGGYSTVTWDARGYPSGVYFYRFESGDFSSTRKMILIR